MPRINSAKFQKIDAGIWTISTYESFLNVKKFKTILNDGFIMIFQIYSGKSVLYIFAIHKVFSARRNLCLRVKTAFLQPFIVVKR